MHRIQCFLIEKTSLSRYTLRRYGGDGCKPYGCHNAHSAVIAETEDSPKEDYLCSNPPETPESSDPRWPTKCDHCDYQFTDADTRQVFGKPLYKRVDSGLIASLEDIPPGAMWYQDWYLHFYGPGPDGRCLMVKLPDGTDWCIDGRASNCTRKDDNVHKCWVREGTPPLVTAGKQGNTCSAGAGSIATPHYHGFLRNGFLETC